MMPHGVSQFAWVKHGKTKHLPSNIFKPFCVWWEKHETSSFLQSQLSWKACHGSQWSTTVHHLHNLHLLLLDFLHRWIPERSDQWHDPVGIASLTNGPNGMTSRSLNTTMFLVPNMSHSKTIRWSEFRSHWCQHINFVHFHACLIMCIYIYTPSCLNDLFRPNRKNNILRGAVGVINGYITWLLGAPKTPCHMSRHNRLCPPSPWQTLGSPWKGSKSARDESGMHGPMVVALVWSAILPWFVGKSPATISHGNASHVTSSVIQQPWVSIVFLDSTPFCVFWISWSACACLSNQHLRYLNSQGSPCCAGEPSILWWQTLSTYINLHQKLPNMCHDEDL